LPDGFAPEVQRFDRCFLRHCRKSIQGVLTNTE
jgi:hypothetical protein